MAKRYKLRRGDTCPCCGQKIETDDPEVLKRLASIALQMTPSGWLQRIGFEWPEEDE